MKLVIQNECGLLIEECVPVSSDEVPRKRSPDVVKGYVTDDVDGVSFCYLAYIQGIFQVSVSTHQRK